MPPYQRLRLTYRNAGCADSRPGNLSRLWADAFQAAGMPLARPEGAKRTRIELGPPLPQGATGEAELLDVLLAAPVDAEGAVTRLASALPPGLEARGAEEIGERLPSLGASVRAARYRATFAVGCAPDDLEGRVAALLALPALEWEERRGERLRRFDLRALIYHLDVALEDGRPCLKMRVALSADRSARPVSVLSALGLEQAGARLVRTAIEVERPQVALRAWRERGRFE